MFYWRWALSELDPPGLLHFDSLVMQNPTFNWATVAQEQGPEHLDQNTNILHIAGHHHIQYEAYSDMAALPSALLKSATTNLSTFFFIFLDSQ